MGKPNKYALLETLPDLIFDCYILKYLSPTDIFNLGRCSQQLKAVVIKCVNHPVSTQLQCIKTTYKHYYKVPTIYDNIDRFSKIDKCGKTECECFNFRQRKDWIIMDPAFCPSCDDYLYNYHDKYMKYYYDTATIKPCSYHCTLMTEIFDLKLCNDCFKNKNFCSFCSNMLDN